MIRLRNSLILLIFATECVHLYISHSLLKAPIALSYHGAIVKCDESTSSALKTTFKHSTDIAVSIALLSKERLELDAAIRQLRKDINNIFGIFLQWLFNCPLSIRMLFLANFVIYSAWLFLPQRFMFDNFSESENNSRNGRWWTVFTSTFSHRSFSHLLVNMSALRLFGPVVQSALGDKLFLAFTLISGAVSSLCFKLGRSKSLLLAPRNFQRIDRSRPSLGFSGVTSALLVLYVSLKPKELISIAGFDSIPARLALNRLVLVDVISFVLQSTLVSSPIAHGAHLGGYFAGYLFRNGICRKFMKKYVNQKCRWRFCNQLF